MSRALIFKLIMAGAAIAGSSTTLAQSGSPAGLGAVAVQPAREAALIQPLPPAYTYDGQVGPWSNIPLRQVPNVSVENLPGATLVGAVVFTTSNPYYSCLNGHALNAWRLPAQPDVIFVHNGDQGPQCVYGTWTYRPFFQATWQGHRIGLTRQKNVTVEALPDATLAGHVTNFQTDDPYYACLDGPSAGTGQSINVWIAPREFPAVYVAHNGDEGPQCVYITLTFPRL
jgi:hypothetical protein